MKKDSLTQGEAVALMVGAGVGAGIMAVPYLAERVGLVGLAILLPIAWAASSLIHLMLAEVCFRTGKDMQIVELMRLYLLRGRRGTWLLWIVFGFLSIAFLANLAAYISGSGEIVANMTGINQHLAEFAIYIISAGVVFFGLKAVGIAERYGTLLLYGCVLAISFGVFQFPIQMKFGPTGSVTQWLALYGMVMYALWTFYSVPQVVKGLGGDHRGAANAILIGLGINGLLTAIVAFIAIGISNDVTKVAIIGIAERLGSWAGLTGSIFIIAAFVTSYWSVSLALADIIHERAQLAPKSAWLLATLPSLLILWIGVWQFLEWLRLAAGATAIVVALITIPMYRTALREGTVRDPGWKLGRYGSPVMIALVLLALILMVAGSIVAIE